MSNISYVLAILGLVCAFTSLGFAIAIANDLRARGLSANPLFVKWMVFRYLAVYKRVTLEETGEVGPLYRGCSVAGVSALILCLGAIFTRGL